MFLWNITSAPLRQVDEPWRAALWLLKQVGMEAKIWMLRIMTTALTPRSGIPERSSLGQVMVRETTNGLVFQTMGGALMSTDGAAESQLWVTEETQATTRRHRGLREFSRVITPPYLTAHRAHRGWLPARSTAFRALEGPRLLSRYPPLRSECS